MLIFAYFPASEEAPARRQPRVGPLLRHPYGLDRRIISFQKHSKMLRKLFYVAHDFGRKIQNGNDTSSRVCFFAASAANTPGKLKTAKDGYAEKMKIHRALTEKEFTEPVHTLAAHEPGVIERIIGALAVVIFRVAQSSS